MVRGWVLCRVLLITIATVGTSRPALASGPIYELVHHDTPDFHESGSGMLSLTAGSEVPGTLGEPDLAWKTLVVPGAVATDELRLEILESDTLEINGQLAPWSGDMPTSDTATAPIRLSPSPEVYGIDRWYPDAPVSVLSSGAVGETAVTALAWCPYRYNPGRNQLIVIRRAALTVSQGGEADPISPPCDTLNPYDMLASLARQQLETAPNIPPSRIPGVPSPPDWTWPGDLPLGIEYVVITKSAFKNTLRPLAEWKARRGLAAGVATIEAIVAQYGGEDQAAQIRNYIAAAHSQGLKWVVLGGDETVVPIRYAYAGFDSDPGSPYNLQVCDLYFVELNGDWDADGDGIYGEISGDNPQIYPELYVGRLLFSTAAEANTIVQKIIAYERGPLDDSYLTKSLHICADQMRDWSGGGQHQLVADAGPSYWSDDLTSMVENPSGDAPAPSAPSGADLPGLLSAGAGWVNYYVHGSHDRFVVRSSGLNESALSYVFTFGTVGDGNGHLNTIPATPRPGIHVSAACDQGAFDTDSPPMSGSTAECVAERLLLTPLGGAVAFIGQSRWGWVSSSWKLSQKFYQYVADGQTPNHVGVYQTLAKLAYPGYRDLIYGNNLHGDPEMPVWKDRPRSLTVEAPSSFFPGYGLGTVTVREGDSPVAGALVTVAGSEGVWNAGVTGGSGSVDIDWAMPSDHDIIITASKPEHRLVVDTIPVSIITDVNDGDKIRPERFSLGANYPNPFNAGTVIPFELAASDRVSLAVYNVLGHKVRTLCDQTESAGAHRVAFDGNDDNGSPLGTGVYFVRLAQGAETRVRKLVLLR
ncbi:MAG TPA: C25 family cysteine peptidase [candidate division Zixibacteria bacterium]|jgi:hypothetical protein